jgi:hypothetical protein
VLAQDIAQTREELSVTIDAIVDRVSPKKVVERGKQQAREGVQDATEIVKVHATTAAASSGRRRSSPRRSSRRRSPSSRTRRPAPPTRRRCAAR